MTAFLNFACGHERSPNYDFKEKKIPGFVFCAFVFGFRFFLSVYHSLLTAQSAGGAGAAAAGTGTANGSDTAQPRTPGGSGPGGRGQKRTEICSKVSGKAGKAVTSRTRGWRSVCGTRPERVCPLRRGQTAGPGSIAAFASPRSVQQ